MLASARISHSGSSPVSSARGDAALEPVGALEYGRIGQERRALDSADLVLRLCRQISLAPDDAVGMEAAAGLRHQAALHLVGDAELIQHLHQMHAADAAGR